MYVNILITSLNQEEEEKKKADQLRKKAEAKALLDAEMAAMKKIAKPAAAPKITRAQIDADNLKREKNVASEKVVRNVSVVEDLPPLEENYNRLMADTTIASNVDEAIAALRYTSVILHTTTCNNNFHISFSVSDKDSDLHPEKRLKAAYKEFETQNLPRIKTENPSLRLSQWKQILWKEWTKSPQNPLNQQV